MIDDQELRAIQFLAERVRKATPGAGAWDTAGFTANLRKLAGRNLHLTIEHVMRHAADPKAKNPGVLLGAYTPEAPTSSGHPHPPKRHEQCRRCGGVLPACACTRDHLAAESDPPAPTLPPVGEVRPGLAQRLAGLSTKEDA